MRKVFLVVLALLALTQALTDKEIIQQTLNGVFKENALPQPTTIVSCIDDPTAALLVKFANDNIPKAAKGSITDLIGLIAAVKDLGNQIPQSVSDCLNGNKELENLGLKYGIDNNTDTTVIEKKIVTYVSLHYLEVHKFFGDLNTNWSSAKYYQAGFDGAAFAHKVLGSSKKIPLPNPTDKEIIQLTLNGLFEENKLADPTTIVSCIDDDTAHKIVLFIGEILEKAAKGSITDLVQLVNLIKAFGDQIPQAVKDCLNGNAEFQALGLKYGITPTTDTSVIEKKVIAYVTLHYLEVHKWLGDLNNNWKAGKYYSVGFDAGTYGHKVLGISVPNPTDKEILQLTLNGLFEENKLPDPTTIVPCIDDDTAHKLVVFIGEVFEKAAKGSISDLIQLKDLIKGFGDNIPQAVKDCLSGNAEFQALGLKYGLTPTTDSSALEKKIIAYVTLHYLEVHKWLGELNNNWKAGKFYQVGFDAGTYGHKVLGMSLAYIAKMRSIQ